MLKNNMPNKPKILIFEDDSFIAELFEQKFQETGFEVKTFNNYDKPFVVDVVTEEKPDVIYCDILTPGIIDGWQAIKLLKKDKRTKDIPVIIVDNMCQKKEIEKGLKAGAVRHICKAHYTPTQTIEIFKDYLTKTGKFTREDFKKIEIKPKEEKINGPKEKETFEERRKELEKIIEKLSKKELKRYTMLTLMGFRPPLTAIKGYLSMLEEGEFKGREETAYKRMSKEVQKVIDNYDILNKVINKYYKGKIDNRENEQDQNNKGRYHKSKNRSDR